MLTIFEQWQCLGGVLEGYPADQRTAVYWSHPHAKSAKTCRKVAGGHWTRNARQAEPARTKIEVGAFN